MTGEPDDSQRITPDAELASLDRVIAALHEIPVEQMSTRQAEALAELSERRWRLRWARIGVTSALDPAAGRWPPPSLDGRDRGNEGGGGDA